eukprot:scaffold75375_cov65-Phaeocystis_antarctica.AAC.5
MAAGFAPSSARTHPDVHYTVLVSGASGTSELGLCVARAEHCLCELRAAPSRTQGDLRELTWVGGGGGRGEGRRSVCDGSPSIASKASRWMYNSSSCDSARMVAPRGSLLRSAWVAEGGEVSASGQAPERHYRSACSPPGPRGPS